MVRNGPATRERILDSAKRITLDRGFAAATLDQIMADAQVTTGAFFHHFESKAALGRAILDRYAEEDYAALDRLWTQAERLSSDPLQQLLLFVGLMAEDYGGITEAEVGCLYASFVYERQLGVESAAEVIEKAIRAWRSRFREQLDRVVQRYPPRLPVDLDALADLVYSAAEGGYIVARATHEPDLIRGQLIQVRTYLELLFGTPAPAPSDR